VQPDDDDVLELARPADQLAQFSPANLRMTAPTKRMSGTHASRRAAAATGLDQPVSGRCSGPGGLA